LGQGAGWLLGFEVGFYLLFLFSGPRAQEGLLSWLALTPDSVFGSFHVWKVVTTTFVNTAFLAVLLDALMLIFFVPVLEEFWGTRRFVKFFLATSVTGNVASALVGLVLSPEVAIYGLSPFLLASVAAFGVVFAKQPVQLWGVVPLKGKAVAIGTAVVLALYVLFNGAWVDGAGYVSAMGLAWALTMGAFTPNLWWLKWRRYRMRRRYHVLDGGADKDQPKKRWMN
jgi:membrane associated rhomboid family serine protease